ncbi:MAG: hypothetical protein IPK83_01765 [Planctomycetes bacterium]|nr:hypothetical protein [Planctomycetota bacterium]
MSKLRRSPSDCGDLSRQAAGKLLPLPVKALVGLVLERVLLRLSSVAAGARIARRHEFHGFECLREHGDSVPTLAMALGRMPVSEPASAGDADVSFV